MTAAVRSATGEVSLEGSLPDHIEAEFNEELWHGEHAPRLQAASLVIGLHPDQACRAILSCYASHRKCATYLWEDGPSLSVLLTSGIDKASP